MKSALCTKLNEAKSSFTHNSLFARCLLSQFTYSMGYNSLLNYKMYLSLIKDFTKVSRLESRRYSNKSELAKSLFHGPHVSFRAFSFNTSL